MNTKPKFSFENLEKEINWEKGAGLIPTIIQNASNHQVLMLGFMNREALERTMDTGLVTFYSRTRKTLWTKGETSSNTLELVDIKVDCDQDSLLVLANPNGPTCHKEISSCFDFTPTSSLGFFNELEAIIESRKHSDPNSSYTASLFEEGVSKICQKVGEEAVETALAAATDSLNLLDESADLLYHIIVLLHAKNLCLADVEKVLKDRHQFIKETRDV